MSTRTWQRTAFDTPSISSVDLRNVLPQVKGSLSCNTYVLTQLVMHCVTWKAIYPVSNIGWIIGFSNEQWVSKFTMDIYIYIRDPALKFHHMNNAHFMCTHGIQRLSWTLSAYLCRQYIQGYFSHRTKWQSNGWTWELLYTHLVSTDSLLNDIHVRSKLYHIYLNTEDLEQCLQSHEQ